MVLCRSPWIQSVFVRTVKTDQPASDVQDDLNFHWAHMQSCRKGSARAQL